MSLKLLSTNYVTCLSSPFREGSNVPEPGGYTHSDVHDLRARRADLLEFGCEDWEIDVGDVPQ
jgi:hypothetical protein